MLSEFSTFKKISQCTISILIIIPQLSMLYGSLINKFEAKSLDTVKDHLLDALKNKSFLSET